ncbi:MAG: hypothetical protein ACR9NN_12820 [Nostochopsis sp.]
MSCHIAQLEANKRPISRISDEAKKYTRNLSSYRSQKTAIASWNRPKMVDLSLARGANSYPLSVSFKNRGSEHPFTWI